MATGTPEPGSTTLEGRIVRTVEPQNEEFDFRRLTGSVTPTDLFYVRNHGPVPHLDPVSWRLEIDGLVARPQSFTVEDLRALQEREGVATLECAGNRRTMQSPVPAGVPWSDGAVSTARWGGVPLAVLLEDAGVAAEAGHVLLEGADLCPTEEGPAPFARSIPLELARERETLIALSMNGEPLPPEHGAPARLVVPRHYAMNCVKWLTRVTLQREPHAGHFQTHDYRLWFDQAGEGEEIGPMRVTATIATPRPGAVLSAGRTRILGAAWTGNGIVERVDVSTDGGDSWNEASLDAAAEAGVWRLWSLEWDATLGEHTLMARATDSAGNSQPDSLPPNRKGYANNSVVPIIVRVE